jgi:hypothetical protein
MLRLRANRSDVLSYGTLRRVACVATRMLALYSPRLAEACVRSGEAQLRAMAEVGCRLALTKTDLDSPVVTGAVAAMLAGRFGPGPERSALTALVAELDHAAYALEDYIAGARACEDAYLRAFQRARAASALLWTLHADARTAAGNALYEAIGASSEDPMWIEGAALAAGGF